MDERDTPVLVGKRDIRPFDFVLMPDARSDLDDENAYCYALTADCDVDEIFGTHVETDENGDTLEFLFKTTPDLEACEGNLIVLLNREDTGAQEEYIHPLTKDEATVLLNLCRGYEVERLKTLIATDATQFIQDGKFDWRQPIQA